MSNTFVVILKLIGVAYVVPTILMIVATMIDKDLLKGGFIEVVHTISVLAILSGLIWIGFKKYTNENI